MRKYWTLADVALESWTFTDAALNLGIKSRSRLYGTQRRVRRVSGTASNRAGGFDSLRARSENVQFFAQIGTIIA
jgi:methylphosphotriester-DNA--protein-cysteine methyltransferase